MIRIIALTRAQWQTMRSYRVQTAMSLVGILVSVVPLYFVARAVQPVMAASITNEGGGAFGFLAVGIAVMMFVTIAVGGLPGIVAGYIRSGTLEALLSTPASLLELLLGLQAFDFVVVMLRVTVLLGTAAIFGATILPAQLPSALFVLALIVLAHLPVGMLGAATVLAFRTAGPFPRAVLMASGLLGGVYYPTSAIPSWLRVVSEALPLSHGLRALRQVLLQNSSLSAIAPDLMVLMEAAVVLGIAAAIAMSLSLRYARTQGTLAQY